MSFINFNKNMKQITVTIILIFLLNNCTSFAKISDKTQIGREDGYMKIYNTEANFKSLTFGDFRFATTKNNYIDLSKKKPNLKNILFYGVTSDPPYEYFVLFNPKTKNFNTDKYIVKDTILRHNNFVILISKEAPVKDIKFLTTKIFEINPNK